MTIEQKLVLRSILIRELDVPGDIFFLKKEPGHKTGSVTLQLPQFL
jgi:hypothetical protein